MPQNKCSSWNWKLQQTEFRDKSTNLLMETIFYGKEKKNSGKSGVVNIAE